MTTPTDARKDELEALAARLTEAQRFCLLDHRPYRGTPEDGWPEDARHPHSWNVTGRKLKLAGLIEWADGRGSHTRLTALGIRVRRILEDAA